MKQTSWVYIVGEKVGCAAGTEARVSRLSGSWEGRMLKENPLDVLPSATGDVKAGPYILSRPEPSLNLPLKADVLPQS